MNVALKYSILEDILSIILFKTTLQVKCYSIKVVWPTYIIVVAAS